MRYLVDTNVMLRFFDLASARNPEVTAAMDTVTSGANDACVCAQVMVESWVAATCPREVNGFGLDPVQADTRLTEIETLFRYLPEPPDTGSRWRGVVTQYSVLGRQAHDARLVALMFAHGVSHILTLNPGDFARYQGVVPVTPAELLSQSG